MLPCPGWSFLLFALRRFVELVILRFERLNGVVCGVKVELGVLHRLGRLRQVCAQFFGVVEPEADIGDLLAFDEFERFLCLLPKV